ncbi:hypothetical protein CapIbe_011114 [Capra ibex]
MPLLKSAPPLRNTTHSGTTSPRAGPPLPVEAPPRGRNHTEALSASPGPAAAAGRRARRSLSAPWVLSLGAEVLSQSLTLPGSSAPAYGRPLRALRALFGRWMEGWGVGLPPVCPAASRGPAPRSGSEALVEPRVSAEAAL